MLELLLSAASALAPIPATDEFHFVVLGDSQFHNPAAYNRMVDDVRLLRPAFVVQVGDMIEGYQSDLDMLEQEWERFLAQIETLGEIPFIPVAGNHDVYSAAKRADRDVLGVYKSIWGEDQRRFDYRNATFIVLNSDEPGNERRIGNRQLTWLQQQLSSAERGEHTFIFMHRPPFTLRNSEALHKLFVDHRVDYVIYGHHHHFHHRVVDGVNYMMISSTANSGLQHDETGSFDNFAHVSIRDEEISVAIVRGDSLEALDYADPEDNYDLFQLVDKLPDKVRLKSVGDNRWRLEACIKNPSPRAWTLYASCASPDDRWQFSPMRLANLEIAPESSETLTVEASFNSNAVPEGSPYCEVTVPMQTSRGHWVYHRHRITGER